MWTRYQWSTEGFGFAGWTAALINTNDLNEAFW